MSYVGRPSPEELKTKIEEISKILRERGVVGPCPRCLRNNWKVDLLGYLVSTLPLGGFSLPTPHVPVLNLTCQNCGSTQLHNLNVLGIKI
jgi:hypothetical protein